jgi:hypothetical protein
MRILFASYRVSMPSSCLARMPIRKDSAATPIEMEAISAKRFQKILLLGHADVVVEAGDDQQHDCQHQHEGGQIHRRRQQQVRQHQQHDRDQIGDAGVDAGLQGVAGTVGALGQIVGSGHRQGRRDAGDDAGHGDQLGVRQGEGDAGDGAGQLHQGVIQAEDDGAHIMQALLIEHAFELVLMALLILQHDGRLRQLHAHFGVGVLADLFILLHALDDEGEAEDDGQELHPADICAAGFDLLFGQRLPGLGMHFLIVRHLGQAAPVVLIFLARRHEAVENGAGFLVGLGLADRRLQGRVNCCIGCVHSSAS